MMTMNDKTNHVKMFKNGIISGSERNNNGEGTFFGGLNEGDSYCIYDCDIK